MARRTRLAQLSALSFDGIRCSGDDLIEFLSCHARLERLHLVNMDITGSVPYRSALQVLSQSHTKLKSFESDQIAQNSYRLYLKKMGKIECTTFKGSLPRHPPDFFDDFEKVNGPYRYTFVAEEWEGVQTKLAAMAKDIAVSNKTYMPEFGMDLGYFWRDLKQ